MAKLIPLTQNKFATVDDEDYEFLSSLKWRVDPYSKAYGIRWVKKNDPIQHKWMHRLLLNAPSHLRVDHIDGNGLNNQKYNLRLCTATQNKWNRRPNKSQQSSPYKGVNWDKDRLKWKAGFRKNGKTIQIGRFNSQEDAALAYNFVAYEHNGEFAYMNVPLPESAIFHDLSPLTGA